MSFNIFKNRNHSLWTNFQYTKKVEALFPRMSCWCICIWCKKVSNLKKLNVHNYALISFWRWRDTFFQFGVLIKRSNPCFQIECVTRFNHGGWVGWRRWKKEWKMRIDRVGRGTCVILMVDTWSPHSHINSYPLRFPLWISYSELIRLYYLLLL